MVHLFIWFAQSIVAIICMRIILVVCESDERSPKGATPEAKETPTEKDETAVKKADYPTGEDTYGDCSYACEQESVACLEHCQMYRPTVICKAKCVIIEYRCYGMCVLS